MRCDFCGEEIEGIPFQKDGMNFCSLECSDALETGESIPLDEEVLDEAEDYEDAELVESDDDDDTYGDLDDDVRDDEDDRY